MNRIEQLETLLAVTGDVNVELNKRTPETRPLLTVAGERANLRVHSVIPVIATFYGQRANESPWLDGEYPLAALQAREELSGEYILIAGIVAVERTLSERSGYVGVFLDGDDFQRVTRHILGADRVSDTLDIERL